MIIRKFSLLSRLNSFKYAFEGVIMMIKNEHNSRIHLFAASLAILLGIFLNLNAIEWSLVVIIIGLVFIAELFNSTVERIADMIDLEINVKIKYIKDLAAAGVLISAIISVIVGGIIFIPKLIELIKK